MADSHSLRREQRRIDGGQKPVQSLDDAGKRGGCEVSLLRVPQSAPLDVPGLTARFRSLRFIRQDTLDLRVQQGDREALVRALDAKAVIELNCFELYSLDAVLAFGLYALPLRRG